MTGGVAVGRGAAVARLVAVVVGAGVAAALAGGCSLARTTPTLRHWVLAAPRPAGPALPAPVRIGTVTADQAYASSRLAVRTSPYGIEYRVYDRWAAPPRMLVANALRDALAQDAGSGAPVEVDAEVRRLEGVSVEPQGARGDLVLALRATQGGAVLLERTYEESEPAASDDAEAVAAALSRALGRVVARFREDLRAALAGG